MNEFTPTEDMVSSAKNVFIAMAMVETIRPIVVGYQTEILKDMQAHISQKWIDMGDEDRIILNPDHSYLLDKKDSETYFRRCNEARIKHGLHVDDPEFCPLLVAEDLLRKAQACMIDTLEPITHLSHDKIFQSAHALRNYNKLVDLSLRLLAPYV